jgi:hypothetical protein
VQRALYTHRRDDSAKWRRLLPSGCQQRDAIDSDCAGSCGNGVLDAGERCDTGLPAGRPGACPVNCDDNNNCTADTMHGSGCNRYCTHANTCPTNKCGDGTWDAGERCDTAIPKGQPGACPTHPNDCNDGNPATIDSIAGTGCGAYCAHQGGPTGPACGNGKLEAGEWCDTGIPTGQNGACPTTCDDKDPCTVDKKEGTGCLAYCNSTPISAPKNNDGCCPHGATAMNDNDCGTACGNGVLEPGESCDPGISSGPGSCVKNCPDDGDPCTRESLTGGKCTQRCQTTQVPPNITQADGCCPAGMTQNQDADCLPPCTPDRTTNCADPCKDVKCIDGYYCKFGKCEPWPNGGGDQPKNPQNPVGTSVDGGCDCQVNDGNANLAGGLPFLLLGLLYFARRRNR